MDLTGRAAVITGGKRMGEAIAVALAARGVDTCLCYRTSKAEAEAAAETVREHGRRCVVVQGDVSREGGAGALIESAVAEFGRLDILVNMASIYEARPFDRLTLREWTLDLDANLTSAFLCAIAAVPHMRAAGGGHIINFSDWVARSGRPRYRGYLGYYVAKSGVIGLTEALALELAPDNILVNAIAPGPILPPPDLSAEEARAVEEVTPLGRWGGELEIAKTVVALIESGFITGETIRVDGGRHVM